MTQNEAKELEKRAFYWVREYCSGKFVKMQFIEYLGDGEYLFKHWGRFFNTTHQIARYNIGMKTEDPR